MRRGGPARTSTAIPTFLAAFMSTEVATPAALDAALGEAVTDGCEGLVCKSVSPATGYRSASAAGCRPSLSGTIAPSCPTPSTWSSSVCSPGAAAAASRGAAAGRLRPGRRGLPRGVHVRRVLRCRPRRIPRQGGAAAGPRPAARPGRRTPAARRVVSSPGSCWNPQRQAEPLAELHRWLGAGSRPGWRWFPRFTG